MTDRGRSTNGEPLERVRHPEFPGLVTVYKHGSDKGGEALPWADADDPDFDVVVEPLDQESSFARFANRVLFSKVYSFIYFSMIFINLLLIVWVLC